MLKKNEPPLPDGSGVLYFSRLYCKWTAQDIKIPKEGVRYGGWTPAVESGSGGLGCNLGSTGGYTGEGSL